MLNSDIRPPWDTIYAMRPSTSQLWGPADRIMVETIRNWMDRSERLIKVQDIADAINSSYTRTYNVLHFRNSPFTLSQFIRVCSLLDKDPYTEVFKIIKQDEEIKKIDHPLSENGYKRVGRLMENITTAVDEYIRGEREAKGTPPPAKRELSKDHEGTAPHSFRRAGRGRGYMRTFGKKPKRGRSRPCRTRDGKSGQNRANAPTAALPRV